MEAKKREEEKKMRWRAEIVVQGYPAWREAQKAAKEKEDWLHGGGEEGEWEVERERRMKAKEREKKDEKEKDLKEIQRNSMNF